MNLPEDLVLLARTPAAYGPGDEPARSALDRLLGGERLVPEGARVVLKPNWVHHENAGPGGLEALVTQTGVLAAILERLVADRPASVVLGDAPVQGCDFGALRARLGLDALEDRFGARFPSFRITDFRRTIRLGDSHGAPIREEQRPMDAYVLFDLGAESLLEPITDEADFRVTMYDPEALARTHTRGRHQYLVAREIADADVVIEVPKPKTHRKAGLTGALKNLVGINGHKDYLAHHRKGGAGRGDNYPGRRPLKRVAEELLDVANRSRGLTRRRIAGGLAQKLVGLDRLAGGDGNIDGSWHGNDTVWRMSLDLVRIVRYGRADGTMADTPQRALLTVSDGVVAGDGQGPLAPGAVPLGLIAVGANPAAVEWVHALLMGFDPTRLPIVARAFDAFRWPLASFDPASVRVRCDGAPIALADVWKLGKPFQPPSGWTGHVERAA